MFIRVSRRFLFRRLSKGLSVILQGVGVRFRVWSCRVFFRLEPWGLKEPSFRVQGLGFQGVVQGPGLITNSLLGFLVRLIVY